MQVKKELTSTNLYLTILGLLREGLRPSRLNEQGQEEGSIAAALGISKQNVQYYLSTLKSLGYIRRIGLAWEVLVQDETQVKIPSKNKSSMGMRKPATNLHAMELRFPILEGKINDKDWQIKNKLKNWIPKYTTLQNLGGLQVRNNNNNSLTIWAEGRDIKDLNEIDNLGYQIRTFAYQYFKGKYGVILDVMNVETKNINIATQDEKAEGMLKKGEVVELDLNKRAEPIFPNDKIPAKAWADSSPFKFTAETNDKDWKREYLRMPFAIRSLNESMPALAEYNKNILLHMEVQKAQLETQKELLAAIKELREVKK